MTSISDMARFTIYPVFVAGQRMFAVRESAHANGFGDSLHRTQDAADKYVVESKEREAANAAFRDKEAAVHAEKERLEALRCDLDGFGEGMSPMELGRAKAFLLDASRFAESRRDFIRKQVAADATFETVIVPKIKPMSRTRFNRANQREQDDHARRAAAAGNKTMYLIGGYDMGKHGYEYGLHLKQKAGKP